MVEGSETRARIMQVFADVASEQDKQLLPLTDEMKLTDTGLDSMCLAHVVARLEDELGVDPLSADNVTMPTTVGEFIALYRCQPR